MIVVTLAVAGVVLIVAALATESWWLLPVALLAHATATAITVLAIKRATGQKEKSDPVAEARLEGEQKRSDPEQDERGRGRDDDEPRMAI